jgi:hypothetical protein
MTSATFVISFQVILSHIFFKLMTIWFQNYKETVNATSLETRLLQTIISFIILINRTSFNVSVEP